MAYSLSNNLVFLRPVEKSDLDFLFAIENEISEGGASSLYQPVSRQMLWQYIESYSADINVDKQLRFIICDKAGKAVGAVDLSDYDTHDRHVFVGISVLKEYRGLGFARSALLLLMDYASRELGIHQIVAVVAADNEASKRLFTGLNFKGAGRLKSWFRRGSRYEDALLFQKLFC